MQKANAHSSLFALGFKRFCVQLIKCPNVQVSDTTGDATDTKTVNKKARLNNSHAFNKTKELSYSFKNLSNILSPSTFIVM
jgi:hypothetical protein